MGQFATPPALALGILELAKSLLSDETPVRFLDPAFGTGAFYSALLRCFPNKGIEWARGFEVDPHYGGPAAELWAGTPLMLTVADFTKAVPPREEVDMATVIVCNPPYVRHHHLGAEWKMHLRGASIRAAGVELSGLAGLYCHFVTLSHAWMAPNALAVWLIPSEFMDVNYGQAIKEYLLNRVTLLRIHCFDAADVQFDDALVSSAVVCFRNAPPGAGHRVEFTYGGDLGKPRRRHVVPASGLSPKAKWTRLSHALPAAPPEGGVRKLVDLFTIKRGIATGSNGFFILPEAKADQLGLPHRFLRPVFPSPRFLQADEVEADAQGAPLIAPRLLLLDCRLSEEQVREDYPRLWAYLETGMAEGIHARYLCRNREPWYSQEDRQPAPLLCTYMGRSTKGRGAFRFILNHSDAIAANVYLLLYPRTQVAKAIRHDPRLLRALWTALQEIPWDALLSVGRVYGGGLYKLEPRELGEAPADKLLALLPDAEPSRARQLTLAW